MSLGMTAWKVVMGNVYRISDNAIPRMILWYVVDKRCLDVDTILIRKDDDITDMIAKVLRRMAIVLLGPSFQSSLIAVRISIGIEVALLAGMVYLSVMMQ